MGREASGWYNAAKGGYFVELGGKQTPLLCPCDKNPVNKAEAKRVLRKILDEQAQIKRAGLTVVALCDVFEDHLDQDREPETATWYRRHLGSFAEGVGPQKAAATVQPHHVTTWLSSHAWGPTTRHGAITAVKRLYAWGKKQGHLASDPLCDMEKPTPRRREAIMTDAQVDAVLAATGDQPFRDILIALRETGARPGELYGLTADRVNVEAGTWTVTNKTRHATGEQVRTVYLTPALVEMSRRLLAKHPEGEVFRNMRGNPWTRNATACRFDELKTKLEKKGIRLDKEGVAYSLRHLYITDALERGIPPATVAELVGHQDLNMIMRIYNKLKLRTQHLRDAVREIRPPHLGQ